MNAVQFLTALENLVQTVQKLTQDQAVIAEATALLAAAKEVVPSGTIHGVVVGVEADVAKLKSVFTKK